jgi:hypothetical protein
VLFDAMLSNDPRNRYLQEWFVQVNFGKVVGVELSRSRPASEPEKCQNLLILICHARRSDILRDSFTDLRIVEFLNSQGSSLPPSLLDSLWSALLSICERQTAPLLGGIFQQAIEIVIEIFPIVAQFRVAALEFVTEMIIHDPVLRPSIVSQGFCSAIGRLSAQFPTHTFLQLAILRFCRVALEARELQENVLAEVVEPMVGQGCRREDMIRTAIACEIVEHVLAVGSGDRGLIERAKGLRRWDEFVAGPFKERSQLIKKGYGGKVPALPTGPRVIPFLDI